MSLRVIVGGTHMPFRGACTAKASLKQTLVASSRPEAEVTYP